MSSASSSILSSYPPSVWDDAAASLRDNSGVALIDLIEAPLHEISKQAFQSFVDHVPRLKADTTVHIPPSADSAHATGYHGASDASSMSRYNQYRQGLVLSDGARLEGYEDLPTKLDALQDLLHSIAEHVCAGIERDLDLPHGWFQEAWGPTRQGSQWHIKRYVQPKSDSSDGAPLNLLPMHTDPSLISVIILNRPGKQEGAQGLSYVPQPSTGSRNSDTAKHHKDSIEIPFSGHAVAIVLVGSVLSHWTGQYYPACRHFVQASTHAAPRMAATLFLRPFSNARLVVPPSTKLQSVALARSHQPSVSFEEWNLRVSRRYMKGRRGR
jgi:isopenicillin N synthase-like dioxygenase